MTPARPGRDTRSVDRKDEWVRAHVEPTGPRVAVRERVWATTWRLPTTEGVVWFKACAPTHRFEAELVPLLAAGWPDLLPRVVAEDRERGWLLLADAGTPFETFGNAPELWLKLLPAYGELQRDAIVPVTVPERTLGRWPELYNDLLGSELPLTESEVARLRRFAARFAELCEDLAAYALPAAIQHDDLHHRNAFVDGRRLRIIDWGDSSRSHPFASLVVPFRFLEERNALPQDDPWFATLRDAYLEPWGAGLTDAFNLAQRLGRFAHTFGWVALRPLLPEGARSAYDIPFQVVLRRALAYA